MGSQQLPALVWPRQLQDMAGREGFSRRCRQSFSPLPSTPIPQSGVLEKLLLVLEKELLNSQKPEDWLLHSWELELGHRRSTYTTEIAKPCKSGLFFPFRGQFASTPPPPPGWRCSSFCPEALVCPRPQPLPRLNLSWAPHSLSPCRLLPHPQQGGCGCRRPRPCFVLL